MSTRVLNRRLPAFTIAAVLTATAVGCGSSPASTTGASSAARASSAAASGAFPVMVRTADGAVRISKRPTSIVSVSPTATEMLYAIGPAVRSAPWTRTPTIRLRHPGPSCRT